ncbi:MAG: prepilin-type N-terminal cleavage/methylation domain [Armatimonadetes bacterium]|jgi:prepilin-type N-terminal cleavage/methylation domain-containing protein|nr:prepilin-type N-terminal cleavage/methylation domain [Armatimonadota bacterium]
MSLLARRTHASRHGFTLIELLVVIAIIALLVAILFPVFASVQESGRRAKCMENMKSIHQALTMYKNDWRQYPDALYGVSYNGGPIVLKLGSQEYVKDTETFSCPSMLPQNRNNDSLVAPVNRAAGNPMTDTMGRTLSFPARDSYDFGYVPNNPTGQPEVHYNRAWTGANQGIGTDPRQLIRKDPPADTVVTWCLNHASYDGAGVPKDGSKALVLFLSGRTKVVEAKTMTGWPGPDGKQPWQIAP